MTVRLRLDTDFTVPPGTNELISSHLVTPAEIARRVGVTRAAVANWLIRHPALAVLAIPLSSTANHTRSYVFWWPQAEACLKELGLPNEGAKRRGRKAKPPAAEEPKACWCADPGRTEDEMYQCPAGDADEECLSHDWLAVGGARHYARDPRMPLPHVPDDFRATAERLIAEAEQERAR